MRENFEKNRRSQFTRYWLTLGILILSVAGLLAELMYFYLPWH